MAFFQAVVTVVLFLVILGVLVIIHELGHFFVAKLARVRVLEFGVGFPPRAKVLRSEGETLLTLNWLPIGGFVKLEGEDGEGDDDPRSFAAQGLPLRLLILVAGVVMNLVLAFAIFAGIALTGDPALGIRAGRIQADSPASAAGLHAGDVIVSLDDKFYPFGAFSDVGLLQDLRAHAGLTVRLGVDRTGGGREVLTATLRDRAAVDAGKGALGIEELSVATTKILYEPGRALEIGAQRTVAATGLIFDGLGQLASSIVNHPTEPPPASGPIGIAGQIGDVFWQLGPVYTLVLAAVLSANLAVVNILPFPPLDGGRMFVLLLKSAFGRRISLRAERLTYLVGFAFLFAFLIWISGFDIARQFGWIQ